MRHLHQLRLLPAFAHAVQLVLGGVGYLVPLAQKRERGRIGLRELAPLRQLVPFGGLERVRFDAGGGFASGMPHLFSGNEKAALVDGLGIQNLMNDRLDKLGDACYSDITTTAPVRRGTQNLIERKLVTRRASAFSWASFRVRVDECQAVVVTVVDALPIIAITKQQGFFLRLRIVSMG